jgi:hypothetical protein
MTAQVQQMVASTQSLAQMADGLREVVARFRVEAGDSTVSTEIVPRRRKSDWRRSGLASSDQHFRVSHS